MFAPGESITTAAFDSDTVRITEFSQVGLLLLIAIPQAYTHGGYENSGTSYATPLVAGTIASIGRFLARH